MLQKELRLLKNNLVFITLGLLFIYPTILRSQEIQKPIKQNDTVTAKQSDIIKQDTGNNKDWHLIMAPYLWAPSLEGNIGLNGANLSVDMTFDEILQDMNYALTGYVELQKDHFFFYSDTILMQLSTDAGVTNEDIRSFQRQNYLLDYINVGPGPIDLPGGILGTPSRTLATVGKVEVTTTMKSLITEVAPGYNVYEHFFDEGKAKGHARRLGVDVYAGIRYYDFDIDTEINAEVSGTYTGPLTTLSRSGTISSTIHNNIDWVDPIIGTRLQYDIMKDLAFSLRGDVGGFGVGSEFAWSTQAIVQWRVQKYISLVGGYKVLSFDYNSNNLGLDMTLQGPAAAIVFDFKF